MSRLKKIRVAGWKSIKETNSGLELGPINVLIGSNAAGKSNLVSYFKLLNEIVGERLQVFVGKAGGADSLLHYGAKTSPVMESELEFETDTGTSRYFMRLVHAAVDTLIFSEERLECDGPDCPQPQVKVLGGGHRESLLKAEADGGDKTARALRRLLSRCRVFHFHDTSETSKIRQPAYKEANRHLALDAGNLAAMLYLYQNKQPAVYRRIVATVRKIVPSFGDFVLEPQRLDPKRILLNWRQAGNEYLFGPHQISDGGLRAMALTTLFLQPDADLPDLVVLDEPELGLHPSAIEIVAGLIRSVSHRTQVLLATQSTTFVNHFDASEIIVAEAEEGVSSFRRLDPAELKDWLEDYTVGELWQKNVIGGGPMP